MSVEMAKYQAVIYCFTLIAATQNIVMSAAETRAALLEPMFAHDDRVRTWQKEQQKRPRPRQVLAAKAQAIIKALGSPVVVYEDVKAYNKDVYNHLLTILPDVLCKMITAYSNPEFAFLSQRSLGQDPVFCLHGLAHEDCESIEEISVARHIALMQGERHIPQEPLTIGMDEQAIDFAESPDQQRSAIVYSDGTARTWSSNIPLKRALIEKRTMRLTPQSKHIGFTTVQFSPCSSAMVLGATTGLIAILNAYTGRMLYSLQADACVTALEFSPDGTKLFAGLRNGYVHVWQGEPLELFHGMTQKDGPPPAAMLEEQELPLLIAHPAPVHSCSPIHPCCCCWFCTQCCTGKDMYCNCDNCDCDEWQIVYR